MATLQGYEAEGNYVRGTFSTAWDDATPVAWGNKRFTKPDKAAWVRVTVPGAGADRASVGDAPIQRHDGMVIIEVFVPENEGEGEIDELCDAAAAVFRDRHDQEGMRFGTPRVIDVGPSEGWYKKDVLCPFVRDTIFT